MIKPLTSLRFFFALCVFLSHLSFLKKTDFRFIFENIFFEGFFGVSFFFILSGFILAFNYKDKFAEKNISLKKFYIARISRIYPLHIATLLVSIPLFYKGVRVLFLNIFLLQSYIPKENIFFSYNAPSWSISSEFFFYAVFPFIIYISAKVNYFTKILGVFIFVAIIILINIFLPEKQLHYWLYISPFTRIFDFTIGIFLFDLYAFIKNKNLVVSNNFSNILEIFSLFTLIVFFLFKDDVYINFRYSVYYWIPMCLIIFSFAFSFLHAKSNNIITNFLSKKWLVYLGEISFAFYLIHYIVINVVRKFDKLLGNPINEIFLVMIMFSITLLSSIFAFEKIEKPFNKKIKSLFT